MNEIMLKRILPEQVVKAKQLAKENGFIYSCLDEVGQLLAVLTSSIKQGTIVEIGTGYGVGTAWIGANLTNKVSLISVDNDKNKIKSVKALFHQKNIKFVHSDWQEILKYAPFQFIFADGGKAKEQYPELLVDALADGGMVLIDDLTPIEYWSEEWKNKRDEVREYWLRHPNLQAVELRVTQKNSVIVATKVKKSSVEELK